MGRGVQTVKVRPGASRYLMRKSPSSLGCYRFWLWEIAGRGVYPRRTGRNKHGVRDPPGNYGFSCSINISKVLQKYEAKNIRPSPRSGMQHLKMVFKKKNFERSGKY